MTNQRNPLVTLYLDTKDFTITDDSGTGKVYTLAQAKAHYQHGEVVDCNLAFVRLANNDFDLEKTKRDYAELANAEDES